MISLDQGLKIMAVKKTASSKATPAAPKKAAKAKAAPKAEAAAAKTTAPAPAPAPKAKAKAKAAPKKAEAKAPEAKTAAPKAKAAKPKAAAVKLSATQAAFLKTINDTGETGYPTDKKVEIKTIESLLKHKLVKKGAKDKASGKTHYHVSSAGKKHLESTTTPSTGS